MSSTEEKEKIRIPSMITVAELAEKLDVSPSELIQKFMQNGVMITINENVDYETAAIIADEFDKELRLDTGKKDDEQEKEQRREKPTEGESRPPVVAVMGHVDHGKTSLLDAIRDTDEAADEAGGITQHISAYQITKDDRKITFLDTPGHEAFSALREHGAKITDLGIIVIAADDGVQPQTKEAIDFAKKSGVPMIIAINKIDTPGSNPQKVRQELSDAGVLVEDWGGEVVVIELSAKENTNVDKLLDMIFLMADVEELVAPVDVMAKGIVIESYVSKGKGSIATVLVEQGSLEKGDYIVAGETYAKIRTIEDYQGNDVKKATPSTPVTITGFKDVPVFGELFQELPTEKEARAQVKQNQQKGSEDKADSLKAATSEDIAAIVSAGSKKEINVIVKGDVQGSVESVSSSIKDLGNEEVGVRVVAGGVGDITESDIRRAKSAEAMIVGFNVGISNTLKKQAIREGVTIKLYDVIYELIEDLTENLSSLLDPETTKTVHAVLEVKGVFRTTRNLVICGGEVQKGKIEPGQKARLIREKEVIGDGELKSLQREQQKAKEAVEGQMCGLEIETDKKINLKEGDTIQFYSVETKERSL